MSKKGYKQSEEHKRKIREANLGKKRNYKDEESRLRAINNLRTDNWLGKKRNNPEYLEKIRIAHLGQKSWNKGKKFPNLSGENHWGWKGDKVGYNSLHSWIRKYKGKPIICEHCGKEKTTPKSIHWANVSGKYLRDLSDWISLCASCHKKYDNFNYHKIKKIS